MFGSYRTFTATSVTPLQYVNGKLWSGIRDRADGGSYRIDTTDAPTTGYVVGGVTASLVVDPNAESNFDLYYRLTDWTRFVVATFPDSLVGFWRDDATGLYHFDVSDHIATESEAAALGRERGEIAIWDIDNASEIRL